MTILLFHFNAASIFPVASLIKKWITFSLITDITPCFRLKDDDVEKDEFILK